MFYGVLSIGGVGCVFFFSWWLLFGFYIGMFAVFSSSLQHHNIQIKCQWKGKPIENMDLLVWWSCFSHTWTLLWNKRTKTAAVLFKEKMLFATFMEE